jgi:hypothetical protein
MSHGHGVRGGTAGARQCFLNNLRIFYSNANHTFELGSTTSTVRGANFKPNQAERFKRFLFAGVIQVTVLIRRKLA